MSRSVAPTQEYLAQHPNAPGPMKVWRAGKLPNVRGWYWFRESEDDAWECVELKHQPLSPMSSEAAVIVSMAGDDLPCLLERISKECPHFEMVGPIAEPQI